MFRKLHSNRDPNDTLLRELKKEFSVYFGKAENGINALLQQYPKEAYGAMLVLMLISLVLSFTILKNRDPVKPVPVISVTGKGNSRQSGVLSPLSGGINQLLQTTSGLKQTMELKQQIDTLLSKAVLSHADSVRLAAALDRLQHLQQSLNH